MLCCESYVATLDGSFLTGSQALDFTCWWRECLLSKQPPSHFLSLWVLPPQTPVALPHLPQPQLLSLNIIQRCFKPLPFFPSHVPLWLRWEKKNLPAMRETQEIQVRSLSWEDPLEKGMATHSSILAWRIPWTEEPGGLQSMGSQRVRHDWVTKLSFKPFLNLKTIFSQRKYTFTLFCRAV